MYIFDKEATGKKFYEFFIETSLHSSLSHHRIDSWMDVDASVTAWSDDDSRVQLVLTSHDGAGNTELMVCESWPDSYREPTLAEIEEFVDWSRGRVDFCDPNEIGDAPKVTWDRGNFPSLYDYIEVQGYTKKITAPRQTVYVSMCGERVKFGIVMSRGPLSHPEYKLIETVDVDRYDRMPEPDDGEFRYLLTYRNRAYFLREHWDAPIVSFPAWAACAMCEED